MNKYSHVTVFSHRSAVLECCRDVEISSMLYKEAIYRSSPPEVFLGKRCSENMQQIYRRTTMCRSAISL